MLRRVVSALALLALVSTPVVAQTRLFCRYTGLEITDCAQQEPGDGMVEAEGCCDRQVAQPLGAVLQGHDREIAAPVLQVLPAVSDTDSVDRVSPAQRDHRAASPRGPPLYVITRALLI